MTASLCQSSVPVVALSRPRGLPNTLVYMVEKVLLWQDRAKSRHALLGLTDHMLSDIGVDRATAQVEGNRPFWQG